MRAYTAWVIQYGKGKEAQYLERTTRPIQIGEDSKKALQFARRSDARKVIDDHGTSGRPVEKTFG